MKNWLRLAFLTTLLISADGSLAAGSDAAGKLHTLIASYPITVIGETHQHPESTSLFLDLTNRLTADGSCLAVALEIASDQQNTLDAVMAGKALVSKVKIPSMIDHPGLRNMIEGLHDLVQAKRCMNVKAVDAPLKVDADRDEWMTDMIENLAREQRVIALVGNLHTMKQTRWTSGKDDPYLAERLERRGLRVMSVMQFWPGDCGGRTGRFMDIRDPVAEAGVRRILNVVAVHEPDDIAVLTDGAFVWKCDFQEESQRHL